MADAGCARRRLVRAAIREIPDWPKPGIMFQVRGERHPPAPAPLPAPLAASSFATTTAAAAATLPLFSPYT